MESGPERDPATREAEPTVQPDPSAAPQALGQILESFRHYLLLVANREVDPDLQAKFGPSDLVQESLLEAHRDFASYRGSTEAELLAWLRKILLHNVATARDHYRLAHKRAVGREVPLESLMGGAGAEQLTADDSSPSKRAATREDISKLERTLAQLPEHYREVLRLRHQENRSFEEIGQQRTARSAEAARKVWARAVEQLKRLLKQPHDDS